MEPRASIGDYNPSSEDLTLYTTINWRKTKAAYKGNNNLRKVDPKYRILLYSSRHFYMKYNFIILSEKINYFYYFN